MAPDMARLGHLLFGAACLALGCGTYAPIASRTAHAQVEIAEVLRRESSVAYTLCQKEARYAYLEMQLGLGRMGPVATPPTFVTWYETEATRGAAEGKKSWSAYCRELDQSGAVFHTGVLALRNYALAVGALADGKDFDGSGLEATGAGAASVAETLSAPGGVVSATKSVGSASASLSSMLVKELREQKLKTIVGQTRVPVASVATALGAYLDALEAERLLVLHHRDVVMRAIDAKRDPSGGFSVAAEGALAFDLAADENASLGRIAKRMAEDKALLAGAIAAQAALSAAAEDAGRERAANDAADALYRLLDEWNDRRPEEP